MRKARPAVRPQGRAAGLARSTVSTISEHGPDM